VRTADPWTLRRPDATNALFKVKVRAAQDKDGAKVIVAGDIETVVMDVDYTTDRDRVSFNRSNKEGAPSPLRIGLRGPLSPRLRQADAHLRRS
jgi:hypothetical protein